jgi:hypothetical protein
MASLRFVYCLMLIGVVSLAECESAFAQSIRRPGKMSRYSTGMGEPFVSPYLRLVQPGGDPGFNYFNLVQPQLQQMENTRLNATRIQGLNRDLQQTKQTTAYGPQLGIRATGGSASYRNYSHFYPSMSSGGAGGAPARNYQSAVGSSSGFGGGFGMY